jgi:tetratricopeptide (TPR) repeat protein
LIGVYEGEAKTTPTVTGLTFLSQMYLQRGRLTGDVQTYLQAAAAADQAVGLAPKDRTARTLAAGIQYTTHEFAAAEQAAGTLVAERPADAGPLAVLGDAQLELGDYAGAATTYGQLAASSPDAAAASVRQARLAFIQGRLADADRLAGAAKGEADASAFGDIGLGYYSVFEGQLDLDRGLYDDAANQYQQALREAPGYHIALAGLAKARAAQGRTEDAIDLYQQAIAVVPQPDYLANLGDLYHLTGHDAPAQTQYGTVEVIATLAAINQQVYNRQLVLFSVNHDRDLASALTLAEQELAVRKDVYGYDAYAWALLANGRAGDANVAMTTALAFGTRDPLLLYHAGEIALALGNSAQARDLLTQALGITGGLDPLAASKATASLASLEAAR